MTLLCEVVLAQAHARRVARSRGCRPARGSGHPAANQLDMVQIWACWQLNGVELTELLEPPAIAEGAPPAAAAAATVAAAAFSVQRRQHRGKKNSNFANKLEKGKKSYALSFLIEDQEKTLTDKQIDNMMDNLIKAFEQKANAKVRM